MISEPFSVMSKGVEQGPLCTLQFTFYKCLMASSVSLSGRWKVDAKGAKISHAVSKKPVLQFVSIKRKDCGEWAVPGVGGFCISFSSFNDEGVPTMICS